MACLDDKYPISRIWVDKIINTYCFNLDCVYLFKKDKSNARFMTWDIISKGYISVEFAKKNEYNMIWGKVWRNASNEDLLCAFPEKFDWSYISRRKKLSERFIRKFADYVDWYWISRNQELSEIFIREFEYKIVWCALFIYREDIPRNILFDFENKINGMDYYAIKIYMEKKYAHMFG